MNDAPAIEISGLHYHYPDGTDALNGIDLAIHTGEKVGIIGANGAGKSTLLLHLNGILKGEGTVRVFGMAVNRPNLGLIRREIGLVFQNPDDQLFCPTLYDDVAFGPRNMKLPEQEVKQRAARALQLVGLDGLEHKSAFHLSVGQKKRGALATVLSMDTRILALDEPTSNLDPRARRELIGLLKGLIETQVIATHDLGLVGDLCSRVVLMDRGKIMADGQACDILKDQGLLEGHGL
jgi:cobalt/nickel transport system ATP-binding protein